VFVFDTLNSEIKLRHYSPKTLKSYRGWTRQLQKAAAVHEADMKAKSAGTFLPDQLQRKYKNAAKEFIWQWFFPAQSLTIQALSYS
jgi:hypothetical protein